MKLKKFHIEVELVKTEYKDDGSIWDETTIDTQKIELGYSNAIEELIKKIREEVN